jgi:hypothetical protein
LSINNDVGAFLENFSRNLQPTMKQKNCKVQQILAGEVSMDTQTKFHVNGDVNIYPCGWVNEQVTNGGVHQTRGRMAIEEDGTSHYKAYRTNTGPKRVLLYETRHGCVEMTRPIYRTDRPSKVRRLDMEYLYVTFKFPKNLGLTLMKSLYEEEADEVMSYLKTRKEETLWKD